MASRIVERFEQYRSRNEDAALVLLAVTALSLVVAFVLFYQQSRWTVVPVAAFLVLTVVGWVRYQATVARGLTFVMTVATVAVLGLIVAFLVVRAWPAFEQMGLEALYRTEEPLWKPAKTTPWSLAPMIVGTMVTTAIATVVAAPLGIAGALYISEIASETTREVVKPGIELMAGIPSITYGFIGFVIVNRFFYEAFQTSTIGNYFTVGVMIGIMALPTIVSVAEDALSTVPEAMKSGALAVGTTNWQTMKSVTVPSAFSGVSAAVLLGVGRAMGETMAATVMIPHTKGFADPVYDVFGGVGETLTTVIAFEGGNATGRHIEGLFAAGVVLFAMVLVLSVTAQLIQARMRSKYGGDR
ncbi:phosphate ABC transporter permease subunit PstC [Halobacterium rubrum]|uniref:phosphate ABC transporter permease subunit PstC n=1 Tax=Halobacterium TaxID=2239 RepID=UPI001F00BADB|nr:MULTISPECIES: phosphate ABC transporter permease subunit PstC [Halobacterium]MDH5018658.1 phosphate ABC transporter permease subunit PstC [Halobacterium rubrum]